MSPVLAINEIISLLHKKKLLQESHNIPPKLEICGFKTDSRSVQTGDAFICIKGYIADGHDYFQQVEKLGCLLLICEHKLNSGLPQLVVKNSRLAASWLAKLFFSIDDDKMTLVGITGTNGKTTTAWLAFQLCRMNDIKSGYIGTLGCFYKDKKINTSLTTPDSLEITSLLADMQKNDVQIVFLEISSHALLLHRVSALKFTTALFLNLSQDHFDFHKDMEEYAKAKLLLFNLLKNEGTALINMSDKWGSYFWNNVKTNKLSIGFNEFDYSYNINDLDIDISQFTLFYSEQKRIDISSPLTGEFNVANLVCALALVNESCQLITLEKLASSVIKLKTAPGRLQRIESIFDKHIYLDYAHTPQAIEKAAAALKPYTKGRLITLIGAGGNRDRSKRPKMLQAALKYSDLVIVTTDNPRHEDPISIISEIIAQTNPAQPVWIKADRKAALSDAWLISKPQDTLLITGKGHEKYQEIKGEKYHFSDEEILLGMNRENDKNRRPDFDLIMLEFILKGKITLRHNFIISNIITDSRKAKSSSLFVPLKGNNFDGHDFIPDVLKYNSSITLCNSEYNIDMDRVIYVDDSLQALGMIARKYRQILSTYIIAITGSTGKTSVKEYLFHILSKNHLTGKTLANENNYLGTARSLLNLKPEMDYAVIELGTNHFGEIDWLTSITLPNMAIITSISASHLEFLVDIDGVVREKKSIFSYNAQKKLYPGDNDYFSDVKGKSFGFKSNNHYRIKSIIRKDEDCLLHLNDMTLSVKAKAEFQVVNAAIAAAAALEAGCCLDDIKTSLQNLPELDKRLRIIPLQQMKVIDDCYNANPLSMEYALKFWQTFLPQQPHIAILGSMLELGKNSKKYHSDIGALLNTSNALLSISIGIDAKEYHASAHFEDVNEFLTSTLLSNLPENSVILVKGSHGIHLEKVIAELKKRFINHESK